MLDQKAILYFFMGKSQILCSFCRELSIMRVKNNKIKVSWFQPHFFHEIFCCCCDMPEVSWFSCEPCCVGWVVLPFPSPEICGVCCEGICSFKFCDRIFSNYESCATCSCCVFQRISRPSLRCVCSNS